MPWLASMDDWRAAHFGIQSRPAPRKRSRAWLLLLILLPVLLGAGGVALYLGKAYASLSTTRPLVEAPPDEARARLLRERAASQDRGIALMSRERLGVQQDLDKQLRLRDQAVAHLRQLESTATSGLTPAQRDNLRIAHSDAVAAAKNATLRSKQLTERLGSFDRRIAAAEQERDAALRELGISPEPAE